MTVARIRPAHGGDAETIHQLLLACSPEDPSPQAARDLAYWQRVLTEPEGLWVAHRGGEAVGMAQAVAAGAGQVRALELRRLCVREEEHGQATAANLLQISIGDAPCQVWVADGDEEARAFYLAHGFELDEGARRREGALVLRRMIR